MTFIKRLAACLVWAAFVAGSLAASDADRDQIVLNDNRRVSGFIAYETPDQIWWKTTLNAANIAGRIALSDVRQMTYRWTVNEGFWTAGMAEFARGRYELAAVRFTQMADSGATVSERVYGAFKAGDCWELARDHVKAAEMFGRINQFNPKWPLPIPGKPSPKIKDDEQAHRLWLDARCREGMNLALAKKTEAATAIAEELDKRGKTLVRPGCESRAAAIRAALALADNDLVKTQNACAKVSFLPGPGFFEDNEIYWTFGIWRAEAMTTLNRPKEAITIYDRLILQGNADAFTRVRLRFGRAMARLAIEASAAVIPELIALDALPQGSLDMKCEARYQAGRLLLDDLNAQRATADPKDETRAQFFKEQERTIRLLLSGAAATDSKLDAKTKAKALLDTLPPDEAQPEPVKTAPAASPTTVPTTTPTKAASEPGPGKAGKSDLKSEKKSVKKDGEMQPPM